MSSLWQQTTDPPAFPALDGDRSVDILIIGGGMAGILCAHYLHKSGFSVLVAEAKTIGGGTTGHTTAKLTAQHGLLYHKLLARSGEKAARHYLHAQQQALQQFQALCKTIDCAYEPQPAYVYSLNDRTALDREQAALAQLGCPVTRETKLPLPLQTVGALRMEHQAQFHPLAFLYALARDLPIVENTFIHRVKDTKAYSAKGTITAKRIVFATHFPFIDSHGGYFVKQYQHRSYVLALKGAPHFAGMYVDAATNGLSFRHHGEYLLLGGGDHRTGHQGGGTQQLRRFARRHYPDATIEAAWAAQDCVPLDDVPYIGTYAPSTPHWLVATGFNKWGMTNSMVAARMIAEHCKGFKRRTAIFAPNRPMRVGQLLKNGGTAALNLLTPSLRRCTHLGCALKWNRAEKTWDCPCHGSRFDTHGHVINNPATARARVE